MLRISWFLHVIPHTGDNVRDNSPSSKLIGMLRISWFLHVIPDTGDNVRDNSRPNMENSVMCDVVLSVKFVKNLIYFNYLGKIVVGEVAVREIKNFTDRESFSCWWGS